MRRFFKIIFSRMTLVVIAILIQLGISIVLPYVFNHYYPIVFNHIYVPIETIITIFGIILMIRIINSDMPIEGQLTWVIILLIFPIFGIFIYFLFVRRRPPRRHKKFYDKVSNEIKQYLVKYKEEDEELKTKLGKYYGQFEYIYKSTGLKTYDNTEIKYLRLGEVFFTELLEELRNAKKYIFMEYFIIERGEMWNAILSVLRMKVKQGVEVRVMYDDLGTINKLPNNFAKKLNEMGIKSVKFNSFIPIMSAVHNNRDHRKMTIIDGKVGFMSGLNLADEYVNIKSKFGHWKDTGIKIKGAAVKNMVLMFLQLYDVQNQKLEDFSTYLPNEVTAVNATGLVCPYGDGPKYFYSEYVAENVYLNIINQAENYVWITTPYLIIDNKLTNALCNAARRGVDVRIITPHLPDKKIIFNLTRSSYKTLQEAGVKILEYSKGFIHAKQVICDDCLAVVGTINFDYRSLLHHYECGTLMYKTDAIKDIKKDFEHLFTIGIDMDGFRLNPFVRLMCAIIKVFTPML